MFDKSKIFEQTENGFSAVSCGLPADYKLHVGVTYTFSNPDKMEIL